MRSISKKTIKIIYITGGIFAVIAIVLTIVLNVVKKDNIEHILKNKSYSYLPIEAKNYIKEVYKETGEVILTEKNKKVNELYLNPQYVEYLTYSDEEKESLGEIPISMIIDYALREETKNINIPSKYDMRDSYVTSVRDQGDLGLCWTFATAGVAESYLLQNNEEITIESPLLISERQIDYVTSRNGIKDYKSEYVSFINRSLGDGGNFYISTIAISNGVSLFDYNSFKEYDDTDLTKMELSDVINYEKSRYEVNSTINVPRMSLRESTSILTDEEIDTRNSYLKEVKKNIMENGGAYVGTYMSSSCQYMDANLNNLVIDVYGCNVSGGHAMQIIGWDDDLEYSYCADTKTHNADTSSCNNVIKGKGVWILKNSWGNDLQYPYLTYDSLYSSIHFIDEMTSTDDRSWDNNYVLGTGAENVTEKTYYLSETKIKDNEKIEKIKFITEKPDTVYDVKVYKKDGTYETFSKTTGLPGLITIEITEDIVVDKNTKIIVSSEGGFIDRVSVFTSNIDTTPYIDLSEYDNIEISETNIRLYSETKNIPSETTLTYKIYNSENQEVTTSVAFSNNIVAENNINTSVEFSSDLESGEYRIDVIYNSNVIESTNIKIIKMSGIGTKDNPYIITNSTQLNQIRDDLDGYYELANDIDLTEDTSEGGKLSIESEVCPQGFGWEAINGFSGTLDGKGHTIKGLHQNNYLTCNVDGVTWNSWYNNGNGLFGSANGNVTIKNLVLENFDINCQGGDCSALLSKYSNDRNDTTEYTATFENIVLRNSDISGVYNSSNNKEKNTYGGGLFGTIGNYYGNMIISNIYLDFNIKRSILQRRAYLVSYISGKKININNIRLLGNIVGEYEDGSGDAVLINVLFTNEPVEIRNILSTVEAINVGGQLFGKVWGEGSNFTLDGVNALNILDKNLGYRFDDIDTAIIKNVNFFDKDTELAELTKESNYSSWKNFDDNWIIETKDGIPRIPVLKFIDFEYTSISDISIKQKLNEHKSIYEYIMPNIESAKRISYKSNDEDIVKIDDNGIIVPQSTGKTTIHIESYYDGYIKDVPITIDYKPHYTIHFDSNDTEDYYKDIEGTMESIEVEAGKSFTLPANKFTQEYYEFKEWNTKADGTGTSYSDLSEIPAMNDKDEITLYVQWWGKERIVNFDANGGTVNPDRKVVRIRSEYGELPIPTRPGYGFGGWDDLKGGLYTNAFTELRGLELTADWVEDAYTIIYDANGGKLQEDYRNITTVYLISESLSTTYAKNGQEKVIYENLYEKVGYKFKEWNTKADGTGTSYAVEDTIQLSNIENDTLRLYAIWEIATPNITYNSNNGTNDISTQGLEYNKETKLTKNTFVREGYTFKEWNTKADGTGTTYSDEQLVSLTEDLTLYAIWNINKYIITFNSNNEINDVLIQELEYNTSTALTKNTFVREGYTFKEWNTKEDASGDSYSDEQLVSLTEDLTLYAIWNTNKYTITYNSNNGTNDVSTQDLEYNTNTKLNKNTFAKEGYTFKEWNTKPDGTGDSYSDEQLVSLTKALTLYAQWEESYDYIINNYSVDTRNNYISKIPVNTIVNDFKENIKLNIGYSINVDSKTINNKNVLYTGGKTKIYKDNNPYIEFINVIIGDINGDGSINSADLLKVRQHLLGTVSLSGAYFIASDINYDNTINSADLLRVRQHLLGTKPIM